MLEEYGQNVLIAYFDQDFKPTDKDSAVIAKVMYLDTGNNEFIALDNTDLTKTLPADAKASDFIHDFVHSDNPKFKGKSKEERIKMALAAFYSRKG